MKSLTTQLSSSQVVREPQIANKLKRILQISELTTLSLALRLSGARAPEHRLSPGLEIPTLCRVKLTLLASGALKLMQQISF